MWLLAALAAEVAAAEGELADLHGRLSRLGVVSRDNINIQCFTSLTHLECRSFANR
jgi:hypothetical protein